MKIKSPPPADIEIEFTREEVVALHAILGKLSTTLMEKMGVAEYDNISSDIYHELDEHLTRSC